MIHLDTLSTLVAATLVLLLGRKLVHSVSLLKKYTIPEPVAGGLLVALALLVLKKSMGWEIDFDMSLKDPLMLAFFATIGLNANLASLRAGGKVLGAPPVYLFEPHQTEQCGWKPDIFLDITGVWELKRKAMEMMAAQEHLWDYYTRVALQRGVQAARNSGKLGIKYAEAYQRIFPDVTEKLA